MGPFDVTKEMIGALGDEQLRTLLGKLLEAEAKHRGIPLSGIAVGGNQTSSDAGVDASIAWKGSPAPKDWLPRRTIFFQSKAEVMAAAALTKEMQPKGVLRPLFADLAKAQGAYIVFSADDPSKLGYDRRLAAMHAAVGALPGSRRIHFDFYGADKIARWTNQHPGVAIWVLEQSGRTLGGWRPFGDWSGSGAPDNSYVFDESERATVAATQAEMKVVIAAMRDALRVPGGVVRLVGISGMGKTRLAEALFDARLDPPNALAASRAIYGDAGLELTVGAALVAEQIAHDGVDAVIVVDNCRARTHGQLAEIVRRGPSRASLLTIDYDVGGEQPTGTLVSLNDNSEDVLQSLLKDRFPALSQGERHHLARFSGGNARIALKIAAAGGEGVDLSSLNDSELLARLFQTDRQEPDPLARRCAEAASLVYAFYVAEGDDQQPEYNVLAQLAGVSAADFYYRIATFLDWGIVQQRGPQRAVMPPPLANMVAAPFVRRSDPIVLLATFIAGPPRLLASFGRRLGQLHAEPAATALATKLYAGAGAFGAPENLNEVLRRGFVRAAPAAPDAALEAIERALKGSDAGRLIAPSTPYRSGFLLLLVHLAHEERRFARAMEALLPYVLADGPSSKDDGAKRYFLERFRPRLSFTLASQATRLDFVDRLLGDADDAIRALAVEAIDHMLDTGPFSSSIDMDFGARSIATEWQPQGSAGYRSWFRAAYDRAVAAAVSEQPESPRAREIIAKHFRAHMHRDLLSLPIDAMQRVRGSTYWDDGWRAANDALHFERGQLAPADLGAVVALERDLRPKSLEECFQAFVLGEPWRHWHPSARTKGLQRNVANLAQAVGRCVGRFGGDVTSYLDRAAAATGHNSVGWFTAGLARSMADLDELWAQAYRLFTSPHSDGSHPRLLAGILESAARRDRDWVESKLDGAVTDPLLAEHLVSLQTTIPLDDVAMRRFSNALSSGFTLPERFTLLGAGGVTKPVDAGALAAFLRELYACPDGVLPALEVLHMRYFGDRTDGVEIGLPLIDLGREFLGNPRTYDEQVAHHDHGITEIAEQVLIGSDASATAEAICLALHASERANRYAYRDFDQLNRLLMKRFPRMVLDKVVANEDDEEIVGRFFGGWARNDDDLGRRAMDLDDEEILRWLLEDPRDRAVRLAPHVPYYEVDDASGELRWSTLAMGLINAVPDPIPVLELLEHRFQIGSGSGPWSLRLVRRRPLISALLNHDDPRIGDWAIKAGERLERNIASWDERDRDRDSRFE